MTGLNATIENNKIVTSVTSATSSLIGGTYPITYRLTTDTVTSDSYLLVTVRDPAQKTPVRVPVDPRKKTLRLPKIILGQVRALQVCLTPQGPGGASDTPTVRLASNPGNSIVDTTTLNNLRMRGTSDSITANIGVIDLTTSQSRLLKGGKSVVLDVNVSKTSTGGNGACDFGTDSTMTLYPIGLTQVRKTQVVAKK